MPAAAQSASVAAAASRTCRMAADDERWLRQALTGWGVAQRRLLRVPARRVPLILTYDGRCSYTIADRARWSAVPHRGEVTLPNGARIPAGPNASNAALDKRNFVVFSLPAIWREVAPKSEIPLEHFLEAIFFHELAHALQASVTPSLSFPALHSRRSLPPSVNDDSVQERFKDNAEYVRDYEAERDLLFRSAAAPTDSGARSLACEALGKMRQRRARYFRGADAVWAEVDELSLTTEGLGEWVGYSWLTQLRKQPASIVLPKFRGRYWSQEHGLAIFLVADRLVPGWQTLLLRRERVTAGQLLARACRKQI